MDDNIGKVINNTYQITGILGKGGMGTVYKAHDLLLEMDVALKTIDTELAKDPEFNRRFEIEAKSLAKLNNANIVNIKALLPTDFGLCLIMEYVDGYTLADMLKEKGPFDGKTVLSIFGQILNAIGHAHRANVVHRDIKPNNIMLTSDGQVKVMDFGLAKAQQGSSARTVTVGKIMGTVPYMSPEQAKGIRSDLIDGRSDIYALGMTLYEAIAGRLPFEEEQSDLGILQAKIEGKIPPPDKFKPGLPKEIVKVVMKAIDKDPEKRYQTAAEMWKDLNPEKSPMPARRNPALYIILALVLAVFGLFLYNLTMTFQLSVNSTPANALIQIDQKAVGATPIEHFDVETGIFSLQQTRYVSLHIEKENYIGKDTGIVLSRGKNSIAILLAEKPGTASPVVQKNRVTAQGSGAVESSPATGGRLIVQAIPTGSLTIDKDAKTVEVAEAKTLNLSAGEHTLRFRNSRCGEKETKVNISGDKPASVTCYFQSYVNIQSLDESGEPFFGTIMLDGVNTGVYTPKSDYPLDCGTHTITVTRVGYVTIEQPQTVRVQPSFEKKSTEIVFHLRTK